MCGIAHQPCGPRDCHGATESAGEHVSKAHFCECGMGAPRHFVRPLILLLIAESPCHGYELIGRLGELDMGLDGIDPSMIYRMLRMMEGEGLATTRLDDSGPGPARKIYELTADGYDVLDAWFANLASFFSRFKRLEKRYRGAKKRREEA
ncbi:MAG: PadR family transcriptional regulator [Actinomycetota bacterium]|nr:PadR family transcriptional regulator [Actinomycetota bacterium]